MKIDLRKIKKYTKITRKRNKHLEEQKKKV